MPEEFVISQCSPTMAGLKTGNLFSCPAEDSETLRDSIRRMNAALVPLRRGGLRFSRVS